MKRLVPSIFIWVFICEFNLIVYLSMSSFGFSCFGPSSLVPSRSAAPIWLLGNGTAAGSHINYKGAPGVLHGASMECGDE